jgi:hypothetical protein
MIYDQRHPLYTKYYRKALIFYEIVLAISICYCMSHFLSIQTEAVVLISLSPFVSTSELHHEGTRPGISPSDTILNQFRTREVRLYQSSRSKNEANCKAGPNWL